MNRGTKEGLDPIEMAPQKKEKEDRNRRKGKKRKEKNEAKSSWLLQLNMTSEQGCW